MSEFILETPIEEVTEKSKHQTAMWDVLRFPNFRLLWAGENISLLGDQFYMIALPLLALAISGGSGAVLGTLLALAGIPRAIFMMVGGAVSDRFSPRMIMLLSNGIRAFLTGLLTTLALSNSVELWHLYVISVIFGIADAFFYPAYSSMLPRVVDEDHLESGNALLQITARLMTLIGPSIAGAVVAALGTGLALGFDTITFLVAIVALLFMRVNPRKMAPKPDAADVAEGNAQPQPGILASIWEGLRYVWNDPLLPGVMLMIAIVDFSVVGPIGVGLPILAQTRFTEGAAAFGLMLSAFGGGSLLGVLFGGMVKFKRRGWLFIALMVLFSVTFGLMAFATNTWTAAILMAFGGVGSGIFNVVGISWLQRRTDPSMMGRVMSIIVMSSVGLQPISNAIAGLLVDVNISVMFAAAGVFILAGAIITALNAKLRALE